MGEEFTIEISFDRGFFKEFETESFSCLNFYIQEEPYARLEQNLIINK
jgi:hypothetical protein